MLPRTRHDYSFQELASLIRSGMPGIEHSVVEVRSVAVQPENGNWYNFATSVRVQKLQEWKPVPNRIELDRVVLISRCTPVDEISDQEAFKAFLSLWRQELHADSGRSFQERINFRHYPSSNKWMGDPGWVFDLYEIDTEKPSYSAPTGPFLQPDFDLFAESIGALASEWLCIPLPLEDSVIRHSYQVVVPDRRGRIESVKVHGDNLHVSIESNVDSSHLLCAVVSTTSEGNTRQIEPLIKGQSTLRFAGATRGIQIWILDRDGEWLDTYTENEFTRYAAQFSVLSQPRSEADPVYLELRDALASGETNRIEFKTYTKIKRGNDKAQEILETVIAFANSGGGTLYIGVNDNLEPVGLGPEFKKDYAGECHGNIERMEAAYVRDILKYISEGVDRSAVVTPEWTAFAQFQILRIIVPEAPSKPYALAASGDIFFRTGANNRKLRQADIPLYFSLPQKARLPGRSRGHPLL